MPVLATTLYVPQILPHKYRNFSRCHLGQDHIASMSPTTVCFQMKSKPCSPLGHGLSKTPSKSQIKANSFSRACHSKLTPRTPRRINPFPNSKDHKSPTHSHTILRQGKRQKWTRTRRWADQPSEDLRSPSSSLFSSPPHSPPPPSSPSTSSSASVLDIFSVLNHTSVTPAEYRTRGRTDQDLDSCEIIEDMIFRLGSRQGLRLADLQRLSSFQNYASVYLMLPEEVQYVIHKIRRARDNPVRNGQMYQLEIRKGPPGVCASLVDICHSNSWD